MSDNKPSSPKNQEADSFLGRLSVVVFILVLLASLLGNLNSPNPEITAGETREIIGRLQTYSVFGWLLYLTIIYLSGRLVEVCHNLEKVFGGHLNLPGPGLAFLPLFFGFLVWIFGWLLWRIPDAIKWVAELFGR